MLLSYLCNPVNLIGYLDRHAVSTYNIYRGGGDGIRTRNCCVSDSWFPVNLHPHTVVLLDVEDSMKARPIAILSLRPSRDVYILSILFLK